MANIEKCPVCEGNGDLVKKERWHSMMNSGPKFFKCQACDGKGYVPIEPPEVEMLRNMQVLKLGPGDVIVLRHPGVLSERACDNLKESLELYFPDNHHIILEEGVEIGVITENEKSCNTVKEKDKE